MRSCVDFPDPSDHSTMISVPGRSSAEKNTSFFAVGRGVFFGDFFTVGIYKDITYRLYAQTALSSKEVVYFR